MEDEGAYRIEMQFESVEKAQEWVAAQVGEFFGAGDYGIVDTEQLIC